MGRRSKIKGKVGESEIVEIVTLELALQEGQVRRGDQSFGAHVEPDVVGVPGWWIEVKREQRPSFGAWLTQLAEHLRKARSKALPLLVWRRDRERTWWAVLRLVDFLAVLRERDHLRRENAELRARLALPPRPVQPDPGARQILLSEVITP